MNVRRNFGEMSADWQDRKTFKNGDDTHTRGFHIVMGDGYEFDHEGGLATISSETIDEHCGIRKTLELA